MKTKTCTNCGENKPLNDFYKLYDGYQFQCKACQKAFHKKHYENNAETLRQRARDYRASHPEKVAESKRKWKKANKEKNVQSVIKYQQRYPEKHVAKTSKWRKENQDKYRNYAQNRRVRKLENGVFEISEKEIQRILSMPCVNCGSKDKPTLDHIIPISLGGTHSIGNLQNLCMPCNSSKGNKVMMAWRKAQ
jgi:5-methylcytosine-specific restriction endonuclease McrA